MAECIEREAALLEIGEWADTFCECDYVWHHVIKSIRKLPAADVRPVVHAKITADGACSACGSYMPTDTRHDAIFGDEVHFCYYCGAQMDADMREVQDDN